MAQWAQTIVDCLKESDISFITFVPDVNIGQIIPLMEEDPYFHVVYAAREEEAVGIAVGAYAAGTEVGGFHAVQRFRQQHQCSGQPLRALPHAHSFLHQHERRLGRVQYRPGPDGQGDSANPGPFRPAPLHNHRGGRPRPDRKGAMQLCYASRQPVALCLTPLLHGGKIA